MLKAWNRAAGHPLRSFHLEALAWKIFDPGWFLTAWWGPGLGMGSDPENMTKFFTRAKGCLRRRLPDPARDKGDVGAYLTDQARKNAISKLTTAATKLPRGPSTKRCSAMPSPGSGNQIAERQRSPEAAELLRAFPSRPRHGQALAHRTAGRDGPGRARGTRGDHLRHVAGASARARSPGPGYSPRGPSCGLPRNGPPGSRPPCRNCSTSRYSACRPPRHHGRAAREREGAV